MSDFSKNMNPPEEGWNRIADKKNTFGWTGVDHLSILS